MEGHSNSPLISVVVPAFSISESLARSVLSALAQTLARIEVIVVVKDPDGLSKQSLSSIKDARLKVKTLPSHAAFSDLVNEGVRQAQSPWIAFLHEYDEWLPRKLELQFQKAQSIDHPYPVISCRLIARSRGKEMIWPRRVPYSREDLSEYLFCQKTPFYGEGLIKFSTILTKKELLTKVPFDASLTQHEDYDWLLSIKALKGVSVVFVDAPDPFVIWSMEGETKKSKKGFDLDATLSWQQSRRLLFTPRAYACFLLTGVSREVSVDKKLKTFFRLFQEAYRYGKPSVPDLLWFLLIWFSPQGMRHRMADAFSRASRSFFQHPGEVPDIEGTAS